MGLAGPKNRTKIGADPRNTNWANNTDRFGHRILTTLGWQPGSTLGDTSSSYHQSGHITAASAAGVKIVLKDDNLGIGCNKRQREDECVGLDGLQSLLGRLNGKGDDELEKEAETRDKLRRDVIVGERYGMRFVRGETYVSSDIDTLLKKIKLEGEMKAEEGVKVEAKEEETKEKKSKSKKEAKLKKETKVKKEESESEPEMATIPITPSDESSPVLVKKERKEKIKREKSSSKSGSATPVSEGDSESKSKKRKRTDEESTEKTKDKKDRVSKKSKNGETHEQRKERRAREKKEKEARKAGKKDGKKRKSKSSSSDSDSSEDESTPAASGTATPSGYSALVGRQAVRHRFIAAKRSAVMDAKALNEIFMIKA